MHISYTMSFSMGRHSKGGITTNSNIKHTSEGYFIAELSECHFFRWTREESEKKISFHLVSTQG